MIGDSNPKLLFKTNDTFYISVIDEKLFMIYIFHKLKMKLFIKKTNGLFNSS